MLYFIFIRNIKLSKIFVKSIKKLIIKLRKKIKMKKHKYYYKKKIKKKFKIFNEIKLFAFYKK